MSQQTPTMTGAFAISVYGVTAGNTIKFDNKFLDTSKNYCKRKVPENYKA